MKVHLKQIPPQGLHLEGEEDCAIRELESEGIRCAGPLRYDIDLGVASGGLWANGSLSQPVELRCVSCLEKFTYEVRVPAFRAPGARRTGDCRSHPIRTRRHFAKSPRSSALRQGRQSDLHRKTS